MHLGCYHILVRPPRNAFSAANESGRGEGPAPKNWDFQLGTDTPTENYLEEVVALEVSP